MSALLSSLHPSSSRLPPEHAYTLQGLYSFPHRMIHPPDPGAQRIRSFRIKPHFHVTLRDILLDRYSPPLSSVDFENFLTYVEADDPRGGVQNLHFLLWLNQYTKQYNAWAATLSTVTSASRTSPTHQTDKTGAARSTNRSHPMGMAASSVWRSNGRVGPGRRTLVVKFEERERPLKGRDEGELEMVDLSRQHDPHRLLDRTKPERERATGTSTKGKASTAPSQTLAYSWFRAKRTFFLPQVVDGSHPNPATNSVHPSHLRLKVHPQLLHPFIADTAGDTGEIGATYGMTTRGHVHPSPARFKLIKEEVEKQLEISLGRFIDVSFTNTGTFRGAFGASFFALWIFGAVMFLLGYLIWKKPLSYQIAAMICFWVGVWGICVCLNGVCFCLLLSGDVRQYFPWEIEQSKTPIPIQPLKMDDARDLEANSPQRDDSNSDHVRIATPAASASVSASVTDAAVAVSPAPEGGGDDPPSRRDFIGMALDTVRGVQAVRDDEEAQLKLEERRKEEEATEEARRRAEMHRIKERLDSLHSAAAVATPALGGSGGNVSDGTIDTETDDSENHYHDRSGIHVSESYSEDYSPPRSLVQVSIDGSSEANGDDIYVGMEQQDKGSYSYEPATSYSIRSVAPPANAGAAFSNSAENHSSGRYPTTLPFPAIRTSRQGSIISSQGHSQRHHQLYDHGTGSSTNSPQHHMRLGPADKKEKSIADLPFAFEALPTQPPPKHLIRSRRAIDFWAPTTSIHQCPLVARAYWEIVRRSFVWAFAVALVAEVICLAFVLPLHNSK